MGDTGLTKHISTVVVLTWNFSFYKELHSIFYNDKETCLQFNSYSFFTYFQFFIFDKVNVPVLNSNEY